MTCENSQLIEEAADRLRTAASTQRPCSPVRELIGSDDIALAYAVQDFNVGRRLKAGARAAGRKIGMTSVAVQRQIGYDQPNYGILFGVDLDLGLCGMVARLNGQVASVGVGGASLGNPGSRVVGHGRYFPWSAVSALAVIRPATAA